VNISRLEPKALRPVS